jgi:twitching motility protein PilT
VLVIDEVSGDEAAAIAVEGAEDGRLVVAALHAPDVPTALARMLEAVAPDRLAAAVRGVVAQALCPCGLGWVPAYEVLPMSVAAAELVRQRRVSQLPALMRVSRGQGMVTLNEALVEAVKRRSVAPDDALRRSTAPAALVEELKAAGVEVSEAVAALA